MTATFFCRCPEGPARRENAVAGAFTDTCAACYGTYYPATMSANPPGAGVNASVDSARINAGVEAGSPHQEGE